MAASSAGVVPRKLIVVFGDAVGVPGDGKTLTVPEARTAAGRGLGSPLRAAPAALHAAAPSAMTTVIPASFRARCIGSCSSPPAWEETDNPARARRSFDQDRLMSLTPQEIDRFAADGFVSMPGVVAPDTLAACLDVVWADTGLDPNDARTWAAPVVHLVPSDPRPFAAAFEDTRLFEAFDQIVGATALAATRQSRQSRIAVSARPRHRRHGLARRHELPAPGRCHARRRLQQIAGQP